MTAIKEIQEFYSLHEEQPSSSDTDFWAIFRYVNLGNFKVFEINSWEDLLIRALGDNYQKLVITYTEESQLDEAMRNYKIFWQEYGDIPYQDHEVSREINYAIRRGVWKDVGITKWTEFKERAIGRQNLNISRYVGIAGVELALEEFREVIQETGSLPRSDSKLYHRVFKWCSCGKWKDFGILNYHDFKYLVLNP